MTAILEHTLRLPGGILETEMVLDIGCGIRPFTWWTPKHHVCIEPYAAYCKVLKQAGYHVIQQTALEALTLFRPETVLLLDVIEHMDKETGLRVLELAKQAAMKQVVVYTPLGFLQQDTDVWGYGGEVWQTHRSGWTPDDFPGWIIDKGSNSFFAIWTTPCTL